MKLDKPHFGLILSPFSPKTSKQDFSPKNHQVNTKTLFCLTWYKKPQNKYKINIQKIALQK